MTRTPRERPIPTVTNATPRAASVTPRYHSHTQTHRPQRLTQCTHISCQAERLQRPSFSPYGDDHNSWRSTNDYGFFRHNPLRESGPNRRPMLFTIIDREWRRASAAGEFSCGSLYTDSTSYTATCSNPTQAGTPLPTSSSPPSAIE